MGDEAGERLGGRHGPRQRGQPDGAARETQELSTVGTHGCIIG
jgi:hypothetical protein